MSEFKPHFTSSVHNDARSFEAKVSKDLEGLVTLGRQWLHDTHKEKFTAIEARQGKRKYIQRVDGSTVKPLEAATRQIVTTFIAAVLARAAIRTRTILRSKIAEATKRRSGQLQDAWKWWIVKKEKGGAVIALGSDIPSGTMLSAGDALILAPEAPYAQAVNQLLVHRRRKRATARKRKWKPPKMITPLRSYGFMSATARSVRAELRAIGIITYVIFSFESPPAAKGIEKYREFKQGSPMIVFKIRGLHKVPPPPPLPEP